MDTGGDSTTDEGWDSEGSGDAFPDGGSDVGSVDSGGGSDIGGSWNNRRCFPELSDSRSMAYDAARERVVFFGGALNQFAWYGIPVAETWEWDWAKWEKIVPLDLEHDDNPKRPFLSLSSLTYDIARGKTVLFGNDAGGPSLNIAWEWNGGSWKRVLSSDPEGDGNPKAGFEHATTYDPVRSKVFLFGGLATDGSYLDESWEWNGTSWRKLIPTDPEGDGNPSARAGSAIAYDRRREKVVIFGGFSGPAPNYVDSDDTWEWDGASWRKIVPTDPERDGNPASGGHVMAYDNSRHKIVMFGGTNGTYETWEWDGVSWKKVVPEDPEGDGNPTDLSSPSMIFSDPRGKIYLFGEKYEPNQYHVETWEWNGISWKNLTPDYSECVPNTSGYPGASMAFDATRKKTVLFGAASDDGVWEWDGERWRRVVPIDPEGDGNPSFKRQLHSLTYDSDREKIVLFGGCDDRCHNDTWEWDGESWKLVIPSDPEQDGNPTERGSHAMAYDSSRRRIVMFGGKDNTGYLYDDTWEFDGVSWRKMIADDPEGDGNPIARSEHALAYDEARAKVILFGGMEGSYPYYLDDLWQWDGSSWRRIAPADPGNAVGPAPRSGHAMVYDSVREKIVLFGGRNGTNDYDIAYLRDTWEWDGQKWSLVITTDREGDYDPWERAYHAMAYDSSRGKTVLFGGLYGFTVSWMAGSSFELYGLNDTWEFTGRPGR